jgi:hypothetical protein
MMNGYDICKCSFWHVTLKELKITNIKDESHGAR